MQRGDDLVKASLVVSDLHALLSELRKAQERVDEQPLEMGQIVRLIRYGSRRRHTPRPRKHLLAGASPL